MKFIEFDKEKCDNCYKCLRICPTKAISFNKEDRKIMDHLCIKCGLCQTSCPREALKIKSRLEEVMSLINQGEKIAVSIAPSFVGAFALENPGSMAHALKAIGFTYIEETAIGAEMVADLYDEYIEKGDGRNIITSCCPSANYLIEQHYPFLISSIIPVVSPMIAHGLSLKKRYGKDTKVVFIGPCLAKMAEAEEIQGAIDSVLTFEELDKLIKKKERRLYDYEPMEFDYVSQSRGRAFPLGGSLKKSGHTNEDGKYRFFHVDGIDACKEVLSEIRLGALNHSCIEMNICEGSCLNGPDMPKNYLGRFGRETFMRKYVEDQAKKQEKNEACVSSINDEIHKLSGVPLIRSFTNKRLFQQEPNIDVIRQTMAKMGKYTKEDELNCGACGYKTCYDKAKAVFLGYSDIETCLPYLREKAESMQSIMIENSPNVVMLLDENLILQEVNPTFHHRFNKDNLPVVDMPLKLFVEDTVFEDVLNNKESIHNRKVYDQENECYFLVNVVYLKDDHMLLAFMTDISVDEQRQKEFNKVKEETLLKTQEVIDKQMRVAQEIASLLGETTAETKMSLRSLHELVLRDRGGF